MPQQVYLIIIVGALILFGIYRRIRRTIGWQPLVQRKLWVRTIIFTCIGLIFLSGGLLHPISFVSDLVGIAIGMILAHFGAASTSFEQRGAKWFFLPNAMIGGIVTALFLGRLVYRFYVIYNMQDDIEKIQAANNNGFQNLGSTVGNSWGAGLILIMFAYYIYYYILVLQKHKKLQFSDKQII